ncbi:MAG: SoxR reducing system RseC family protein [Bacteroidetes bacterium]|nr:SoxR reducing system RseC family protein [Bacteroidota bacterium]MBL6962934.1 SoxR reducing system RseC family protein [Bacteroidota bacterium]
MSDQKNYIEHEGIVIKSSPSQVDVKIIVKSGCASCHIKGACNFSDIQEKVIEVRNPKTVFEVGEKVLIGMENTLGYKALFLGYLFPFAVIIITLFLGISFFQKESIAAGLSLAMAAIYYVILYFFKDHLQKVFRYKIMKIPLL